MAEKRVYPFEHTGKFMKKLDYTLAGKNFHLVFDNGEETVLSFLTGEIMCLGGYDEPMRWERYAALRADENTYMVSFEQKNQPARICDTYVLDLSAWLVTRVYARQRVIPGRDRMTIAEIQFGAIKRDGEDLPAVRHGYTTDLVGKKATWHYANGFINTHIYYDANYYRIKVEQTPPPNPSMTSVEKELAEKDDAVWKDWFFDEPTRYIKISDNLYLISFIEENLNKANPKKGGSNFLVLINIKEGFDVCRSFTHTLNQIPEWGLSKAYGDVVQDEEWEKRPKSPYRV